MLNKERVKVGERKKNTCTEHRKGSRRGVKRRDGKRQLPFMEVGERVWKELKKLVTDLEIGSGLFSRQNMRQAAS